MGQCQRQAKPTQCAHRFVPRGDEKEARQIVGVILDAVLQYHGAVALCRERRPDGRKFWIAPFNGSSDRTGCVVGDVDAQVRMQCEKSPALLDRHSVRSNDLQLVYSGGGHPDEALLDDMGRFIDDGNALVRREHIVSARDWSRDRILAWQQSIVDLVCSYGGYQIIERAVTARVNGAEQFVYGFFTEGSGLALISDNRLHAEFFHAQAIKS